MTLSPKEAAIARLNAIGISNLLEYSIKPRPPLSNAHPRKKLKLFQPDRPFIPLAEYDEVLILNLVSLAQEAINIPEVKKLLLSEVQERQRRAGRPHRKIRQVMSKDVSEVMKAVQCSSANELGLKRGAESVDGDEELDLRSLVEREVEKIILFYPMHLQTSEETPSFALQDFMSIQRNLKSASSGGMSTDVEVKLLPVQPFSHIAETARNKIDLLTQTLEKIRVKRADMENTTKMPEADMYQPLLAGREAQERLLLTYLSTAQEKAHQAIQGVYQEKDNDEANDNALFEVEQAIQSYERSELE